MWVATWRPRVGGVSLLRYALNFLVVIIAAFLWTILAAPLTHAADASWNADTGAIKYNNLDYQGPQTADGTTPPGLPDGAIYYQHLNGTGGIPKAKIIYFPKDTDLKNTTTAKFAEYDYDQGATQKYSNATGERGISIDKQPASVTDKKEQTSCVVNGIGYIICPIMNFLADTMDKVYDVLKRFLNVKPLSTETNSGLYKAWSYMLALANILFVIGFLVIIYSYITNQGVKQYDLRTIIPRLIVAAVLINASYYICAIAVDVSNIFGANLQDIFNNIRKEMVPNDVTNNASWSQAATFILSGGTIGVFAGITAAAVLHGSVLTLLIPILTSAVIAVLVVVVVLAARQALITVLIILAPIAFAAFILPSTQKYFDKWKDVFMTMLVMYPMFSLLFGGSQLAATLIAQNANSPEVILFAMFIQVAPLVITPFLIKFSGSLLGKVAGMVNNPAKGLGDRANNWGKEKREEAMARQAQNQQRGWKGLGSPGVTVAKKLDNRKRNRANRMKEYEARREAQYWASDKGQQLARRMDDAELAKTIATDLNAGEIAKKRMATQEGRQLVAQSRLAEVTKAAQQKNVDAYKHEIDTHAGQVAHAADLGGMAHELHTQATADMVNASRTAMAEAVHKVEMAEMLDDTKTGMTAAQIDAARNLQREAAGVAGKAGTIKVKAKAMSDIINAGAEDVKAVLTASPVKAGDAAGAGKMLQQAIDEGDVTSMRAYTDMLAVSSDAGIRELRRLLTVNNDRIAAMDGVDTYKHHINSNGGLNQAAEDIGSWSREISGTSFIDVANGVKNNWASLSPEAFAGMKKSSQLMALGFEVGADGKMSDRPVHPPRISIRTAQTVMDTPSAQVKVKDEAFEYLKQFADSAPRPARPIPEA